MLKKMKKRGIDLATEMRDPLAASQRRGKGRKSKATGILIAVLLVLGGVSISSTFSSQSNNSQNTPTPSSDPSPSYQQPTINKDYAVNYAQSDQLSVVNTTKIDNAFAQHTTECSIDALGHYDDLTPECKVQQRLVLSVVQNEIETIPALFEIDKQLVLHHNNVDETVQFFLVRDKYPKMISIWINFGRFITGGVIGGNGGLGGGRPGGGGGGGGRSTLPFSPPPLMRKVIWCLLEKHEILLTFFTTKARIPMDYVKHTDHQHISVDFKKAISLKATQKVIKQQCVAGVKWYT